jgi:GntR family transcriptional regulator/MocR family aminotransferase
MRGWSPELAQGEQPLFLQIAEALVRDVRRGQLRAGDRLPSTRVLARQLGVNRNTVTAAWRELSAQGWIEARARGQTRVAAVVPSSPRPAPLVRRAGYPVPSPGPLELAVPPPNTLSLAGGRPDLRWFPVDELARAWRSSLRRSRGKLLEYGDPQGHLPLREALGGLLASERGLRVQPDELVVTRGSQQALYLLAQALLRPGDRVAVERLGYPPAWAALRAAGAELVPIDIDSEGLVVEQVAEQARRGLRMLYCTPHHQFPTMITLSASRRLALLELARERAFAILEDDYDHEFHFRGRSVPPLASHDRHGVVVYVGTVSKVLAPGLRLGFLAAPPEVVRAVLSWRVAVDRQGDTAMEAAIAELIDDGTVLRHLRRMRRIYSARQQHLVALLREHLGQHLQFEVPAGGLALWAHAPDTDVARWQARALRRGVSFEIGRRYDLGGGPLPYLRVGFASLDEDELDEAVLRLVAALS